LQCKYLRLDLDGVFANLEKVLREFNDILHFSDGINTFLNRLFMICSGGIEDSRVLLSDGVNPLLVARATERCNKIKEKARADEDYWLIIEDVEFFWDCSGKRSCRNRDKSSLRQDGTSREGIDKSGSTGFRLE
jgi:hypothetical protein